MVLLPLPFFLIAKKFELLSDPEIIMKPFYIINYVVFVFVMGTIVVLLQVNISSLLYRSAVFMRHVCYVNVIYILLS